MTTPTIKQQYEQLRAACLDYHSYETSAREKMAAYRVILSHIKREPEKEARADADLAEYRDYMQTVDAVGREMA